MSSATSNDRSFADPSDRSDIVSPSDLNNGSDTPRPSDIQLPSTLGGNFTFNKPEQFFHFELLWTLIAGSATVIISLLTIVIILAINLHFIGLTGKAYLIDGVGLGNIWVGFTVIAVMFSLNAGLLTLSSQAFGQKNYYLVGAYYHRALLANCLIFVIGTVLILLIKEIFVVFDTPLETRTYAFEYVVLMLPGLLAFTIFDTTRNYLISQQIFWTEVIIQCLSCIPHWFLCQYFAIDKKLGCEGLGIATSITFTIQLLLLLVYIFLFSPTQESWFWFTLNSISGVFGMLEYQMLFGFMIYVELAAYAILVIIASSYPADQFGGYLIASTLFIILAIFPIGIATAVTACAGKAIGKADLMETKRTFRMSLVLGSILVIVMWTLFFLLYQYLTRFLAKSDDIDPIANQLCIIYLFLLPIDFMGILIGGYVRAIGLELLGFLLYLVSFYLLGIPAAFILGNVMHLYGVGLVIGMGVAMLSVLLSYLVVLSTHKLERSVEEVFERIDDQTFAFETSKKGDSSAMFGQSGRSGPSGRFAHKDKDRVSSFGNLTEDDSYIE